MSENVTSAEDFFLLPGCQPNIILGLRFLANNKFFLSFEDNIFGLNCIYQKIDLNYEESEQENKLFERANSCLSEYDFYKNKIKGLINHQKLINPELGCIKNLEHTIHLKDKTPFTHKPCPISLTKLKATGDEITKQA